MPTRNEPHTCGRTARPGGAAAELDLPPDDVAVDCTNTTRGASGVRRVITRHGVIAVTVDATRPRRADGVTAGRITNTAGANGAVHGRP